jgi:hypothetical protein
VLGVATATSINGTNIPSTKTLVVTTDKLSALAATTSAELAGVISDETGSGLLVFATSPTLTTPNIGTATGTSFNSITGLSSTTPAANGTAAVGTGTTTARADHVHPTTGLGLTASGLNQFAATTSAQLAGVISDETGSGALVFGTSPTIATPNLSRPVILAQGGNEGGEIHLSSPPTGSTIATGLNIDLAGNGLRLFESGGTNRGLNIDVTTLAAGASSVMATTDTAQTFSNKLVADATTTTAARGAGYMGVPQSAAATTGAYTIVAADAGEHIYSTATRTVTIPANASVEFPVGSAITFIAATGTTVTIAITSDTLILAGTGATGNRTLAPFGMATAIKITSTSWIISGNGLT